MSNDTKTDALGTVRQRYDELGIDKEVPEPIERLRTFCCLALNDWQSWLDIETFFDAVAAEKTALEAENARLRQQIEAAQKQERSAFKKALTQTYEMVDPLNPPPAGSYFRGEHEGIIAALKTMRANYDAALPALTSMHAENRGARGDAIQRSKRILALVDEHMHFQDKETRDALRHALYEEFAWDAAHAEKPVAWINEDRTRECISDEAKQSMMKHGGAGGRAAGSRFSIPLYARPILAGDDAPDAARYRAWRSQLVHLGTFDTNEDYDAMVDSVIEARAEREAQSTARDGREKA